jgi:hypothetical protein
VGHNEFEYAHSLSHYSLRLRMNVCSGPQIVVLDVHPQPAFALRRIGAPAATVVPRCVQM